MGAGRAATGRCIRTELLDNDAILGADPIAVLHALIVAAAAVPEPDVRINSLPDFVGQNPDRRHRTEDAGVLIVGGIGQYACLWGIISLAVNGTSTCAELHNLLY